MSSDTVTRLSGCLAVFTLSLTGLFLIDGMAESVDDRWGESGYEPPHLLAFLFCFAPLGLWTAVLQPALLALLYWLITQRQPPPLYHLVWHALALGAAMLVWGVGVFVFAEMVYLNGSRPVTHSQIVANVVLTALLVAGVAIAWHRRR